jgi:hypothetical protein
MGNKLASNHPLYVSPNIKWKSGPRKDSVPAPLPLVEDESKDSKDKKEKLDANEKRLVPMSYEKMRISPEFKNFFLENLDSDFLVSSVLNLGPEDQQDNLLLEGIKILNPPEKELEEEIKDQLKQFEKCVYAGVEVSEFFNVKERLLIIK